MQEFFIGYVIVLDMDSKLIDYIKKELSGGVGEGGIRNSLKENGWTDQVIDDAFSSVKRQFSAPQIPVPVPPPAAPKPIMQESEPVQVQKQPAMRPKRVASPEEPKEPDLNSPYSVILSVGLLFSLFVLGNQVFSDLSDIENLAKKLAIEAVVFVPFLLITSAISFVVNSSGKRYKILVYPFYLLSGWLFLRLFWETLWYIYDQSATFGIYIALGLIIALLTGVIMFVQRNMNKNQ